MEILATHNHSCNSDLTIIAVIATGGKDAIKVERFICDRPYIIYKLERNR